MYRRNELRACERGSTHLRGRSASRRCPLRLTCAGKVQGVPDVNRPCVAAVARSRNAQRMPVPSVLLNARAIRQSPTPDPPGFIHYAKLSRTRVGGAMSWDFAGSVARSKQLKFEGTARDSFFLFLLFFFLDSGCVLQSLFERFPCLLETSRNRRALVHSQTLATPSCCGDPCTLAAPYYQCEM